MSSFGKGLRVRMGRGHVYSSRGPDSPYHRKKCSECERDFCSSASLRRHVYEQHVCKQKLNCPQCSKTFARKHDMEKHCKKVHKEYVELQTQVLNNLKEELDDTIDQSPDSETAKCTKVTFPDSIPPADTERTEDSSTVVSDFSSSQSYLQTGVQTSEVGGTSKAVGIGQRVIERITKELLDEDGKVVARVVTERFLVD